MMHDKLLLSKFSSPETDPSEMTAMIDDMISRTEDLPVGEEQRRLFKIKGDTVPACALTSEYRNYREGPMEHIADASMEVLVASVLAHVENPEYRELAEKVWQKFYSAVCGYEIEATWELVSGSRLVAQKDVTYFITARSSYMGPNGDRVKVGFSLDLNVLEDDYAKDLKANVGIPKIH